jgi:hypothetical protein
MGAVNMAGLAKKARTLVREDFVARHPNLFLVIAEPADKPAIGFETAVVSSFTGRLRPADDDVGFEVLEVSKAPGNPYPERISVGRARNCDVVMRDASVSKLHAHFRIDDNRLEIIDLESQNGTRVNGRALLPNTPEWVAPGDTILFGTVSAKLVDAHALFELLQ